MLGLLTYVLGYLIIGLLTVLYVQHCLRDDAPPAPYYYRLLCLLWFVYWIFFVIEFIGELRKQGNGYETRL